MRDTRAYVLVGPTAVGKTDVAHWIAEREGFEILSADAMQVYRGMDVGTAKPSAEARRCVRYWGLDVVSPAEEFSVAAFVAVAGEALRACQGRGLIVVGGTGLYIKSLTEGLAPRVAGSADSRARWQAVLADRGTPGLDEALQRLSPAWYAAVTDHSNPRRLMRALELAEAGLRPVDRTWTRGAASPVLVGIRRERADLWHRIEDRVRAMYEGGLVEEVRGLLGGRQALGRTARQAIGYAEAAACLEGRCSLAEAMDRTVCRTRRLAKRQMTWFRHQANVRWITAAATVGAAEVAREVLAAWEELGPVPVR